MVASDSQDQPEGVDPRIVGNTFEQSEIRLIKDCFIMLQFYFLSFLVTGVFFLGFDEPSHSFIICFYYRFFGLTSALLVSHPQTTIVMHRFYFLLYS